MRLYQEGSTAERIADEVTMSVGAVNNVLERRIPGYAEFLAKKSLALNKAKTAAKEEAARAEAEAMRLEEEKKSEKAEQTGGLLVESYKQAQNEPEPEPVSILTAGSDSAAILTSEEEKETKTDGLDELLRLAEEAKKQETAKNPYAAPVSEPPQETVKAAEEPVKKPAAKAAEVEIKPEVEVKAESAKPARTAARRAAKTTAAESEEVKMSSLENNVTGGDPAAKAAQKIALFAKAQIDENDAKIKALSAQIAEINEAITALKIENEQYKALIK